MMRAIDEYLYPIVCCICVSVHLTWIRNYLYTSLVTTDVELKQVNLPILQQLSLEEKQYTSTLTTDHFL